MRFAIAAITRFASGGAIQGVPYQYAPVQVAVLQVHPYPDDAHVGPGPLAVIGRVVAAGDRSAM